MDSLIKAKFNSRFLSAGRVLSVIGTQKQRVLGRIENIAYISLYNPLEDKWALVRNTNANYPCYSLDDKGNPIVIYVDRVGNIRERQIKQEMFLDILENSEGSQEFRELLKAAQNILKSKYSLEFIKPSLGYGMDIPHSCQKGKGHFFKWCDSIAKMAILRDNKNNIIARCLIWDKANITHNGEHVENDIADRLYGNEGLHKVALKNELKKLRIESVWAGEGDERPFEYGEYILKLPEQVEQDLDNAIGDGEAPFLDTFSHYNESEGTLLSFHWSGRLDYNSFEWDGNTTKVLLDTSGGVYCENDDEVWDNYNGEYISQEDSVEPLNYDGYVHRDSCIYSDYHDGYIVDDGDVICVRTINGYGDYDYTYMGSGVELIEINDEVYFLDNVRRYRA